MRTREDRRGPELRDDVRIPRGISQARRQNQDVTVSAKHLAPLLGNWDEKPVFRLRSSTAPLRAKYIWLIPAFCLAGFGHTAPVAPGLAKAEKALRKKDFPAALAAVSEYLDQNPADAQGWCDKGLILFYQHKFADSVTAYNASLKIDPALPASIGGRAYAHEALGDIDQAIADASQAIEILRKQSSPTHQVPMYMLRRGLYTRKKAWDLAIADANFVVAQNPHDVDARGKRALLYLSKTAFAEAEEDLDEAILANANAPDPFGLRAIVYASTGREERAIADLEQCLALSKGNVHAANDLAWLLATTNKASLRNPARALQLANEACLKNPRNPQFIDTQAAAFAASGDFDLAIKSQTYALTLCAPEKKADFESRLTLYQQHRTALKNPTDQTLVDWDRKRFECFDVVWRTVDEQYFDVSVTGAAWRTARENYRLPLSNARNDEELRWTLQQMLGELHRSHFAIIPRETAVFHPEERARQGTCGVHVAAIGESLYIARVDPKSAGNRARLVAGEQIISVEGENIASMYKSLLAAGLTSRRALSYIRDGMEARFNGPVNRAIKLEVTGLDRTTRTVDLLPQPFEGIWSEPVGNFPSEPVEFDLHRDKNGIAYARFNVFALPVVKPLKTFFKSLAATDGLIIDLRGNPGGAIIMAPGLCGWLCDQEATLGTMQMRDDQVPLQVYPQSGAFTGPIAVLIDGSSASTSEIFSAGLRGLGRARLFGTPTAGAALPSLYRRLPNGDLFQYAVGDIRTAAGTTLEGSAGVPPDTEKEFVREDLLKGRDPVLEAARTWLVRARKEAPPHRRVALD